MSWRALGSKGPRWFKNCIQLQIPDVLGDWGYFGACASLSNFTQDGLTQAKAACAEPSPERMEVDIHENGPSDDPFSSVETGGFPLPCSECRGLRSHKSGEC